MKFSTLYNILSNLPYLVRRNRESPERYTIHFTSGNHDQALDPLFRRKVEVEDCRFDPTESCWKPTGITEKVYLPFFDKKLAI
jgi:hypothetical protein